MPAQAKPRRRRIVGANAYPPVEPSSSGPTPEQEAENAAARPLIAAFGAISDCSKLAPLDQTIGIALEALAFAARRDGGDRGAAVAGRIGEVKAELVAMLRD